MRLGHPEAREGEMWLFNLREGTLGDTMYDELDWETKRRGTIAYDLSINIIPNVYPVFIQISEYRKSIDRFFL